MSLQLKPPFIRKTMISVSWIFSQPLTRSNLINQTIGGVTELRLFVVIGFAGIEGTVLYILRYTQIDPEMLATNLTQCGRCSQVTMEKSRKLSSPRYKNKHDGTERCVSVPSYGVPKKLDGLSPPMMLPEPTRNKYGANSLYCQCCVNNPKIFVTLEDANSFYLLYNYILIHNFCCIQLFWVPLFQTPVIM